MLPVLILAVCSVRLWMRQMLYVVSDLLWNSLVWSKVAAASMWMMRPGATVTLIRVFQIRNHAANIASWSANSHIFACLLIRVRIDCPIGSSQEGRVIYPSCTGVSMCHRSEFSVRFYEWELSRASELANSPHCHQLHCLRSSPAEWLTCVALSSITYNRICFLARMRWVSGEYSPTGGCIMHGRQSDQFAYRRSTPHIVRFLLGTHEVAFALQLHFVRSH